MAKEKLGDLIVDFSINPRGEVNSKAVLEYSENMREYIEQGLEINKVWEQTIEITSDKIVVRGSHTVLALREIYDDDHIVEVKNARIGTKIAKGMKDASWLAAQSNKKGINFGTGEVSNAIKFMLDQMQPTAEGEVEDKRPFMNERELAAVIGCGRSQVNTVRNKWYTDNGFGELVAKRRKRKGDDKEKTEEDKLKENVKAAQKILDKEKGKSAAKPKKTPEGLSEEIDSLDEVDLSDNAEHPLDSEHVEPVDEDPEEDEYAEQNEDDDYLEDLDGEEDEEPEDEEDDDEDIREIHKNEFEEHLDNFVAAQPDMMMLNDADELLCGANNDGVIFSLAEKHSPEEVAQLSELVRWIIETVSTEVQ